MANNYRTEEMVRLIFLFENKFAYCIAKDPVAKGKVFLKVDLFIYPMPPTASCDFLAIIAQAVEGR